MHHIVGADMLGREGREDVLDVQMDVGGQPFARRVLRCRDIEAVDASGLRELARDINGPNAGSRRSAMMGRALVRESLCIGYGVGVCACV